MPTKIHPLMQGSEEEKQLSRYIEPPMRLADILEVMQTQSVDCAVVLEGYNVSEQKWLEGSK